jgi:hypothetical protein
MNTGILPVSYIGPGAGWAVSTSFIVIFIICLVLSVLPILLIVLIVRSLIRNKKENQRLRLEVGKLADELQQIRKQAEDKKGDDK